MSGVMLRTEGLGKDFTLHLQGGVRIPVLAEINLSVSQFLRVVPRVSALDVVAEILVARGTPLAEARGAATDLLCRLNIPARLHGLPPATFSGGEQQRVNLARGFIGGHPILLLDEPTASLDPANRDVVVGMIADAKKRGIAIIGIFHDVEVRDSVADQLFPVMPLQDNS